MEIKQETISPCYVWERRDLPIDSSFNKLEESSGMSRTVICTAMERLEPGKKRDKDSFYYQVRTGRLSEQEKTQKDYNTKASALFWEIEELVRAMAAARLNTPKAEGDVLAQETFRELSHGLVRKKPDTIRYPDYYSLRSDNIKTFMFEEFWPEIHARLVFLSDLLTNQSPKDLDTNLRAALPVLDALIIQLVTQPSETNRSDSQPVDVSTIKSLYKDLLKFRTGITRLGPGGRQIDFGQMQPENEIKELVDIMIKPRKTLTPAELDAFEKKYDKILCTNDPVIQDLIPDAREFMQRYSELHTYIKGEPREFEAQVRKELQAYVHGIFEDLRHCDEVPYSYDTYRSDFVQAAFLSSRLKNAHEQIRAAIHVPLYHLRMYNTLDYYGAKVTKNGEKLTEALLQDLNTLAETFPQLPLYHSGKTFDTKAFVKAYTTTAAPYLDGKTLPHNLVKKFPSEKEQDSWARLLQAECELIAAWNAESTVHECVQQVEFLKEQLAIVTEHLNHQEKKPRQKKE